WTSVGFFSGFFERREKRSRFSCEFFCFYFSLVLYWENMARTLEKPRSAENPRVEVESESSPEREYLVLRALEHTNQQLNLLDSVVAEGISTKDYFDETELIKSGLQEEFPQSLAVQEGMNALVSFDQMLADHFYIASERNEDRLTPKKKEALMRLA